MLTVVWQSDGLLNAAMEQELSNSQAMLSTLQQQLDTAVLPPPPAAPTRTTQLLSDWRSFAGAFSLLLTLVLNL